MSYTYYQISKKSNYAIKALLELALQGTVKPINVRKMAEARQIPLRFLEIILNELKQGGFVRSIRGKSGGYLLADSAENLDIGQILVFLEKLPDSNEIPDQDSKAALGSLMANVNKAVAGVFERTTLQELVEAEIQSNGNYAMNYSI